MAGSQAQENSSKALSFYYILWCAMSHEKVEPIAVPNEIPPRKQKQSEELNEYTKVDFRKCFELFPFLLLPHDTHHLYGSERTAMGKEGGSPLTSFLYLNGSLQQIKLFCNKQTQRCWSYVFLEQESIGGQGFWSVHRWWKDELSLVCSKQFYEENTFSLI